MARFLSVTISGLSGGMIYAAVALSLVLIWRATRVARQIRTSDSATAA